MKYIEKQLNAFRVIQVKPFYHWPEVLQTISFETWFVNKLGKKMKKINSKNHVWTQKMNCTSIILIIIFCIFEARSLDVHWNNSEYFQLATSVTINYLYSLCLPVFSCFEYWISYSLGKYVLIEHETSKYYVIYTTRKSWKKCFQEIMSDVVLLFPLFHLLRISWI